LVVAHIPTRRLGDCRKASVQTAVGLDHNGCYEDDFVRENGRWRIAHRRVRAKWLAEDSCLNQKVTQKKAEAQKD